MFGFGILVGSVIFCVAKARAEGIPSPTPLTYSGRLEDGSGAPASGTKQITIEIYDAETGGTMACSTQKTVDLDPGGRFSLALDDKCKTAVSATPDLWVEVKVDSASLGRTKLGAVPYAVEAAHAVNATSATKATNADNATGALATHLATLDNKTSAALTAIDDREGSDDPFNCKGTPESAGACAIMCHRTCASAGYKAGIYTGENGANNRICSCIK